MSRNSDRHKAFFRPTTTINKLVKNIFSFQKPRRQFSSDILKKWQRVSFEGYESMVGDIEALNKVVGETEWIISNETPPYNLWYGEATFKKGELPRVVMYQSAPVNKIPTDHLFDYFGQAGMDHIFGHLYPFYAGSDDFGEEAACKSQYLVAKSRKGIGWKVVSLLIPLFYLLHKNIPLSNFK